MKKYITVLTMILAISACSSTDDTVDITQVSITPVNNDVQNTIIDEPGYQCERVKQKGSNIPKKLCTTQLQRDNKEEKSKSWNNDWLRARGETTGRH